MSKLTELLDELCPDGVEYRPFSEVIERLRTGLNPRKNFILNSPGSKNYYITVRELGGFNIETTEKTDLVNDAGLQLIQNRSGLRKGDVLFSGTGTIGRTALVSTEPKDWNIKEGVYALTPDHSILDSRFLVYALNSSRFQNAVHARAAGGTVKSVSMKNLSALTLPVPPLEVQQEIARVLDAFTDLEQSLVSELELRKKQLTELIGLLIDTPSFDSAPLRSLVGNGILTDGDWVESKDQDPAGEVRLTQLADVGVFRFLDRSDRWLTEDAAARLKCTFLKEDDILIARMPNPIGRACLVPPGLGQAVTVVDVAILRASREVADPRFLNYALNSYSVHHQIVAYQTGGTRKRISRKNLEKVLVPLPPLTVQQDIAAQLDAFSDLIQSIEQEINLRRQQYEFYRDELLSFAPKED